MQKQSIELKETLTKNIMNHIDKKISPIIEENEKLKQSVSYLKSEIEYLKKERKSNNIVIYGLEESENSTIKLLDVVNEIFKTDLNISVAENEVNRLYRLGRNKTEGKHRPVLLSLINGWKKDQIMNNKKSLKGIHISEDYSKEMIEKRKALLPQLIEEKKKGNIAYLKYDKLIVKGPSTDKRKRETSTSPQLRPTTKPKTQHTITSIKTNRTNAYDL